MMMLFRVNQDRDPFVPFARIPIDISRRALLDAGDGDYVVFLYTPKFGDYK